MNSSFPNRWSFSYLKFTKYVTKYRNVPKFSDRQVCANIVDPDQTLHFLPFCLHLVDPLLSVLKLYCFYSNYLSVRKVRIFTVQQTPSEMASGLVKFARILMTSSLGLLSVYCRQFITEFCLLNDVRISFPFYILRMNKWILTKCGTCININNI